ncbi:hypothetical protein HYPSUDRAFT_291017 [Hypholoma sublateritium FD-334 SS-4]|uniref:Uncharacterized protein n=1 Tax=Hypholoma sublateritium (strain FD-334 SS-4) TaxID=945553 RepID=A0A0D2LZX6_HYPSF|nr:hypothetical protein HYPSUDRAFT_291017 [Hypholoma sublateritium FD-334 SS-4]
MSTRLCDNARIHKVLEHSPWPDNLRDITSHLECAFAPISNEIIDKLSPFSKEIYNSEVRNSSYPISLHECHQIASPRPITDFLDTLLSTVQNLRHFTQVNTGNLPPRPTFPILMPLFSALALGCSPDADILTDVPFLLPRMSEAQELKEEDSCEGCTSLLISAYIPPKQDPKSMEADDDNEVSSPSESSSSITNKISFVPFEGPVDGHILPGYGQRVDCVLPVVCIADQDNILALVTSIIYQRRCWGISLPAVGILIDRTGTIATIVIGWINKTEAEHCPQNRLPPVNLAFSSSPDTAGASKGVYDLLDPLSALQFGHFISRLSEHFPVIENCISDSRTCDLCWRLDHVQLTKTQDPHSKSPPLDLLTRIEAWVREINPLEVSSLEVLTADSTMSKQRSTGVSSKQGLPKLRPDSLQVPIVPESAGNNTSRFSASSFAKLKEVNGTRRWLWERETLRLGRFKVETKQYGEIDAQINQMIDEYDRHCALAWPKEWEGTEYTSVSCDAAFRDTLKLLFSQYKAYRSSNSNTVELADSQFSFLKSRLHAFLSSVVLSRGRIYQAIEGVAINEAERRIAIDVLMNFFWCTQEDSVSDTYFTESTIRLPLNKGAAGILNENQLSALWTNLAVAQLSTTAATILSNRDAYRTATRVQMMVHDTMADMQESGATAKLEKFRQKEPSQAACDGLAGARISIITGHSDSTSLQAATKMAVPTSNSSDKHPVSAGRSTPGPLSILRHRSSIWSSIKFALSAHSIAPPCPGTLEKAATPAPKPTPGVTCAASDSPNPKEPVYHESCMICPHVSSSLQIPSSLCQPQRPQSQFMGTELFFPLIFCEYKHSEYEHIHVAFHQCQMDCVSGVESLRALGVTDFPVYGLVAAGSRASIMMAWHSTKAITPSDRPKEDMKYGCNILIDQNLVSFDLGEPLDTYRLAISLHRIHLAQHEHLKRLLTSKHMDDLRRQIETEAVPAWAMPPAALLVPAKVTKADD